MRRGDLTNRRRELRFGLNTGAPLRWQDTACDAQAQDGWIKDLSESGLAMLVARDAAPNAGRSIEVQYTTRSELGVYQILRVESVNEQTSLVACRRETESRPWDDEPDPGLGSHVDVPARGETIGAQA